MQKRKYSETQGRFAIRKLTVGVTSVLLGLVYLGVNQQVVKADTTSPVVNKQTESLNTYSALNKFLRTDDKTNENSVAPASTSSTNQSAIATTPKPVDNASNDTSVPAPTTPNPSTTNGQANITNNLTKVSINGDCDLLWDASSNTLHVKAGANGNKLAGSLAFNNDCPVSTNHIVFDDPIAFPADSAGMFEDLDSLKDITGLDKVDTSQVVNMSGMFDWCHKLSKINLSSFNTEQVTDMSTMFRGCYSLTDIDLSKFVTKKVTNMGYMFQDCLNLINLDLSNFDVSKVTAMPYMFDNCCNLENLNIDSFDIDNNVSISDHLVDAQGMFNNCVNLKKLNLSRFGHSALDLYNTGSKYGFVLSVPGRNIFIYLSNCLVAKAVGVFEGGTVAHPVGPTYTSEELGNLYNSEYPPAETYIIMGVHDNERYVAKANDKLLMTVGQNLNTVNLSFTDKLDDSVKSLADLQTTPDLFNDKSGTITSVKWSGADVDEQGNLSSTATGVVDVTATITYGDGTTSTLPVTIKIRNNAMINVNEQKEFLSSLTPVDHTVNDPDASNYLDLSQVNTSEVTGYTWSGDARGTTDLDINYNHSQDGSLLAYIVVHYQDGTQQAVLVPVRIKPQNLQWQFKQTQPITVKLNTMEAPAEFSTPSSFLANTNLIKKITWAVSPDTSKIGSGVGFIKITFADGTSLIHAVEINVVR
ncbi:BspA family leucine-rich repeat surface protein [Lactobacillus sp. ESL0679]|uniref:BspA family leucine-rich repeat surface protein n=1 Tax=Lactobacillus sp. ESL0679 TaxID=2983209 RepID=UPI0023F76898|nr:BspA family leucine-rich repeat surface protein [Lactobacillus sp. ESL0679]MDF7683827.1 BspA family leucine-rich repeat surface protein [Lactobacillus sp. ESL0679]